jgi:transposase-like protein
MDITENGENKRKIDGYKTFDPSVALNDFSVKFFNYFECHDWVMKKLHPDGFFCIHCGHRFDEETSKNLYQLKRVLCRNCKKYYSAKMGTILHHAWVSPAEVFIMAVLMALGIDNERIAKIINIHPDSIRLWRLRFESGKKEDMNEILNQY